MADEGTRDTFEFFVAGKTRRFNQLKRSQLLMMQRMHQLGVEKLDNLPPDADEKVTQRYIRELSDATWIAIESLFTSEEDLQDVRKAILRGEIEENDLVPLLFGGDIGPAPVADDADPAPKKPRKAAAKKAAPKKAAPRRAAR